MAKKEVKKVSNIREKVSRFKQFLLTNRFNSSINRLRREKVRELEILNKGAVINPEDLKDIRFVGLKKLSVLEVNEIQTLTSYTFKKIKRKFPKARLTVTVKRHDKAGKRCKYTINYRLNRGTTLFASAKQDDWELPRALHRALKNLEQEIKHKYKLEGKRRR